MGESRLLKDLLEFTRDGEWGKGKPEDGLVEMAVIRGTDFSSVRRGDISSVPRRFIPKMVAARKSLAPGDLLIETAGGTKDQPTGRSVYMTERLLDAFPVPVTCASFSRFLRVNRELVNRMYLFWYLQFLYSTGEMLPYHVQHTGVARFQYTDFASRCRVPLPSQGEQAEIADALTVLDHKIGLNWRMNETLEVMARALFKDWFVDFGPTRAKAEGRDPYLAPEIWDLFPDSLDDEEKPTGWSIVTLTALAEVNPETWSRRNAPQEVEYVDLANTKWGSIKATQRFPWQGAPSRARRVLRPGDAIVGMVRPGNGSFAFVGTDGLTGSTGFAVLRPRHRRYMALVYLCATAPENIDRLAYLADGAAYPAVLPEVVGQTEVAVPDDALMMRFAGLLAPILDRMESNKRENYSLAQTRDLLLPKLMNGEIRLAEAKEMVEDAA